MNKNEEIEKIKQALIERIKLENDSRYVNLSADEIMKIIINSSNKGKYVLWVLREYLKGNIQRFEDMGRVKQALILFKNNLSKFTEQQKQLNKLSFQELETLIEPYQDVLTQNEIKRMNKEKIWSEIDVVYEGAEGRIYVPKTEQAAIFLGQGTKWCTASINDNMFDNYSKKGELYIFVLNKKDEKGREIKYQLHFESGQFMNSKDVSIDIRDFGDVGRLVDILSDTLSLKQKIKHFLNSSSDYISILNLPDELMYLICIEKIKIYPNKFQHIPERLITAELCELAVAKYGYSLYYVPKNFITKKLCELAVHHDGRALCNVPNEFKTRELCELAVQKSGLALKHVPEKLITHELCKIAVQNDGKALECVPKGLMKNIFWNILKKSTTKELCELAVQNNGLALEHVPKNFITKELCEIAVKQNGVALEYIPNKLVTPELRKLAVGQDGYALHYVPMKHRTPELYNLAVKQRGTALHYVPYDCITKELCELAVKSNYSALFYVPQKFVTPELCKLAVTNYGGALEYVPNELKTQELCETAVKQNKWALGHVPEKLKTYELCKLAVENSGFALYYVPNIWRDEFIKKYVMDKVSENNMNYSFEEIIEMFFSFKENQIKNLFKNMENIFMPYFTEIKSEELAETLNSNTLSFFINKNNIFSEKIWIN